jgi:hypothetical protein
MKSIHTSTLDVLTKKPDYSDLPDNVYEWTCAVYGKVEELLPVDAPEPLGKHVTLSHYVDANLKHDVAMGRSVTWIPTLSTSHLFSKHIE